jgi:hypothetical protein
MILHLRVILKPPGRGTAGIPTNVQRPSLVGVTTRRSKMNTHTNCGKRQENMGSPIFQNIQRRCF